jgi:uncharacterized protein (DUF2147 family)
MKKNWIICSLCFLLHCTLYAEGITGFWKTVDEDSGKPQSIVAVYPYQNKYYGRLILTYDPQGAWNDDIYHPKTRAEGVSGHPYYSGLDFIWGLQQENGKYTGGKILDPEKGRVYDAEAWIENGKLVVRGELLVFGRNQTWPRAAAADFPAQFVKPDLNRMVPSIPQPIE